MDCECDLRDLIAPVRDARRRRFGGERLEFRAPKDGPDAMQAKFAGSGGGLGTSTVCGGGRMRNVQERLKEQRMAHRSATDEAGFR